MTHTHESLIALADDYATLTADIPATTKARAALSVALKQMCDDLDAFDKAENSFMRKAIELEAEVERLKKQVIRAANFELDLLRALDGQVTLCGFDEIAEVEKLKADNADLRRDEALNEAEAEIEKWKAVHEVNADTLNAMQAEIEQLHKANMELGLENGDLQDALLKVVQDAERLSETLDRAFIAHPNLDLDIDAAMKEKP